MNARGQPLTLLAFDPQPDLVFPDSVHRDDKVFVSVADYFALDLAQHSISRDATFGVWLTDEDPHPTLFYQWPQLIGGSIDRNHERGFTQDIPAQLFHEERLEV